MKTYILILVLLISFSCQFIAQSTVVNPIRLKQELPPAAKNEDYYREGMEQDERRKNIILKLIGPDSFYKEKYATFLKNKNVGIVKLYNQQECSLKINKLRVEDLEKLAKTCPTNSMVGNARNFSFRKGEYSDTNQSDLTFDSKNLYSKGLLTLSLMVSLGDKPIEQLDIDSLGVKFLKDFAPPQNAVEIDDKQRELASGFERDGLTYATGFNVLVNHTYALRAIAYRADLSTYTNYLGLGIRFDPFRNDKRMDVIVVFQIIGQDEKGITIIWKELQRKDSPKLKRK